MAQTLLVGRTNVVTLDRVRDTVSGDYLPASTAKFTLFEKDGVTPVSGALTNVPLAYVAGTHATFEALIPNTAPLVHNRRYVLHAIVTTTFGDEPFELDCYARKERC